MPLRSNSLKDAQVLTCCRWIALFSLKRAADLGVGILVSRTGATVGKTNPSRYRRAYGLIFFSIIFFVLVTFPSTLRETFRKCAKAQNLNVLLYYRR